MTADAAFVVPQPVVGVVVGVLVVRWAYLGVCDMVALVDRRAKAKARQRKARLARRLHRKADWWFAATSVLSFVGRKDAAVFTQERAGDLFDRGRAVSRARLEGFWPRVVLPASPERRVARRSRPRR